MCMQCMAGASLAFGTATTTRSWLATRSWITPKVLKRATIALLATAVTASCFIPAATPPPAPQATGQPTTPLAVSSTAPDLAK